MQNQTGMDSWWPTLTVWGVVNAVNLLQSVGFLSRLRARSMAVNHTLGYVIILLAIPSTVALVAYVRAGEHWIYWVGPVVFVAFVTFMVIFDYVQPTEFRAVSCPEILVPYLVLFFGAILLMGLPMYWLNRNLWLVTVVTTTLLLGSMSVAMRKGMG